LAVIAVDPDGQLDEEVIAEEVKGRRSSSLSERLSEILMLRAPDAKGYSPGAHVGR
jgi:hypothetical protein